MDIGFNPEEIDLVKLRERLRQMNDAGLRSFERDALYMTSPAANAGQETRDSFVLQLDEARAELKRRHDLGAGSPTEGLINSRGMQNLNALFGVAYRERR
jgi:hypothetical protein